MKNNICLWCGKVIPKDVIFCSDECHSKAEKYNDGLMEENLLAIVEVKR
jgi:predicted nucleic acid-binding Zn ribbon protein